MKSSVLHYLFLCSFLLITLPAFSQDDGITLKGVQIGISQPELFDQYLVTMPGLGSNARDMLREQSVKPYMMPPRDRGAFGSPICYPLASCLEFYANYRKNYKVNLSPDYIALNLDQDDLRSAMTFLVENGTVSAAIMPYQGRSIPSGVRATTKYRLQNYLHLFRIETKDRQKIFETRRALMRGNPVIVQLRTSPEFPEIRDVRNWEPQPSATLQIEHLVVVGYDEEAEAFELMGSYGSDWANDGYIWVRYTDFARFVENGFVVVPLESYEDFGQ